MRFEPELIVIGYRQDTQYSLCDPSSGHWVSADPDGRISPGATMPVALASVLAPPEGCAAGSEAHALWIREWLIAHAATGEVVDGHYADLTPYAAARLALSRCQVTVPVLAPGTLAFNRDFRSASMVIFEIRGPPGAVATYVATYQRHYPTDPYETRCTPQSSPAADQCTMRISRLRLFG